MEAVFPPAAEPTFKTSWVLPSINGFRIFREIGRGTFGIVYEAIQESTDLHVAIKVARPEIAVNELLRQRFLRECKVAQSLNGVKGIVPIVCSGESNGYLFLVMEYCRGTTLSDWLQNRPTPPNAKEIAAILFQVAKTVGHGHQQGIVHRDIKPANIMIEGEELNDLHIRVVDFGLAFGIEDSMLQTQSSMLLGTPLYMSPEQVSARRDLIGPTTDVFALGAILYQGLVGFAPFFADSIPSVLEKIRQCSPASPSHINQSVPFSIETICLKCLARSPADRYATAMELADDLERFLTDRPIHARRATRLQRFRSWLRMPDRISEFGLGLLAINSLVLGWALLNYPIALLIDSFAQRVPSAKEEAFLPIVAAIIPVHGALWWSSYRIHRHLATRLGITVHLLFTLLIAIVSIGTICFSSSNSIRDLDHFQRIAALGLMSSFAEVQSILLIGLLAFSPLQLQPSLEKPRQILCRNDLTDVPLDGVGTKRFWARYLPE